jgi:iron complex transport system ATP-binding protein
VSDGFLVAEGLEFAYGASPVIRNVSLAVPRGASCGLIGPNGCGKSTLLRLLSGVVVPSAGSVLLEGRPLASFLPRERARAIAYVPQQQQRIFPFTAIEVVLTGRSPYTSRFEFENEHDRTLAYEALDSVGAGHLAPRPITELSAGEQQLVSVARALAQQAKLVLLDEPSASLDLKHRARLLSVLAGLRESSDLTTLIVTHDLQMLDDRFDRLFAMRDGRLEAEGPPSEVLRQDVLAVVYDDTGVRAHRQSGRTFVWSEG